METKPTGRRRRETETSPYLNMVRRMIRGAGVRVAAGDVDDLRQLVKLAAEVEAAAAVAVAGLREQGYTWQSIGDAVGTTRQAALMKWRPRELGPVDLGAIAPTSADTTALEALTAREPVR